MPDNIPLTPMTCSTCATERFQARGATWCPTCDLETPESIAARLDPPEGSGGVGAVVSPVSPPMVPAGA